MTNNVSHKNLIFLVMLISTSTFVATDLYLPSLPAIARTFEVSEQSTQLTITMFLLSFGFSQLIYGPLSDHFGRRPVLLIGFTVYVLGSLASILASTMDTLFFARFIQGLGAGVGASLGRILLRDVFQGSRLAQATSYAAIGISITPVVAPLLGGYIQQYFGFRMNFLFMFIYGFTVGLILFFHLPETNIFRKTKPLSFSQVIQNYRSVIRNKVFLGNAICSGLAFSTLISYAIMNPFILQETLGFSAKTYGLLTIFVALGFFIGASLNARLVLIIGTHRMMFAGAMLIFLSGCFLLGTYILHSFNAAIIVIACGVATVGIAIIFPNTIAEAFTSFPHIVGSAGALLGSLQLLISTSVSILIASFNQEINQLDLAVPFVLLSMMMFITLTWLYRQSASQPVNENE